MRFMRRHNKEADRKAPTIVCAASPPPGRLARAGGWVIGACDRAQRPKLWARSWLVRIATMAMSSL
jgi:hypothetical protein